MLLEPLLARKKVEAALPAVQAHRNQKPLPPDQTFPSLVSVENRPIARDDTDHRMSQRGPGQAANRAISFNLLSPWSRYFTYHTQTRHNNNARPFPFLPPQLPSPSAFLASMSVFAGNRYLFLLHRSFRHPSSTSSYPELSHSPLQAGFWKDY